MNLAARFEGFAGPGEILISPATYQAVRTLVQVDDVRKVEPKGFGGTIEARNVTAMGDQRGAQLYRRPGAGDQ